MSDINQPASPTPPSLATKIDSYLRECETTFSTSKPAPRIECCGKNQRIYCNSCGKAFNSSTNPTLPSPPFEIEVIRHDKADQATGIQLKALDVASVVDYSSDDENNNPQKTYDENTTYILFPSASSQPITDPSVSANIKKLLVFDCKWTKSISLQSPAFKNLKHVKLGNPPPESRYWRWHNGDPGFLCTVEATVVALIEATGDRDCWVRKQ